MRIGHGFDAHRFGPGSFVILGGVNIPHKRGIEAHSDGDVVLHALCDALLGAAGLGDIGQHFPDSDEAYRGADSRDLLRAVMAKLKVGGLRVGNVDLTIVAQRPRLAEHLPTMQQNIAADLEVAPSRVNLKATTTERMGFVGREEGISTYAVALLEE
jgi:2-C-methyl-D-erythritol 2,4-cyclodiphosphate synthase